MSTASTPSQVAQAATTTSPDLNTSRLTLLGTFGAGADLRALLRLGSGKTVAVKVGDKIGQSPIAAIEEGRLALAKGGGLDWLEQP